MMQAIGFNGRHSVQSVALNRKMNYSITPFLSDNCPLLQMRPIGYMESCFKYKNGTPRQPGLVSAAQGRLTIDRNLYSNPEHSLKGLEEFSHVW